MTVNPYNRKDYEKIFNRTLGQNKPNSNPIKPNFRNAQMNVNLTLTKDYRKNDDFAVQINKPNSNPISEKPKMNVNNYYKIDYNNKTYLPAKENKPKQTQIKPNHGFSVYYTRDCHVAEFTLSAAKGGPRNDIFWSFPAKSSRPA